VLHTEALALAIPQLSGKVQVRARGALVERMARMTARTLRDKFEDEDAEVRRAAALACAMKEQKEHVPRLIELLEDPEPPVARAAYAALKSLTGQDFGPAADASRADVKKSAAAWKAWWAKNAGK
jgi:HEAT repeat protein